MQYIEWGMLLTLYINNLKCTSIKLTGIYKYIIDKIN